MFNPIRRNRNIGTSKQGHGKDNRLVIPYPAVVMKIFYERLTNFTEESRTINGNRFEFVIEQTREDSLHACTVDDIAEMLRHIKPEDYGRLNLVVLRQPKRKEEIVSPVWGRLIYSYEFKGVFRPAIIIESQTIDKVLKWSKRLGTEEQKELDRLVNDGHEVINDKRYHLIKCTLNSIRNTQLYRTLPHEIGHYKHFLEEVGEFKSNQGDDYNKKYDLRETHYHNLEVQIKERYAHQFAKEINELLLRAKVIPFDRINE